MLSPVIPTRLAGSIAACDGGGGAGRAAGPGSCFGSAMSGVSADVTFPAALSGLPVWPAQALSAMQAVTAISLKRIIPTVPEKPSGVARRVEQTDIAHHFAAAFDFKLAEADSAGNPA